MYVVEVLVPWYDTHVNVAKAHSVSYAATVVLYLDASTCYVRTVCGSARARRAPAQSTRDRK